MAFLGIQARRRRLEGPSGRFLLLALDHGMAVGPLPGIEDPASLLRRLRDAPITGVIANPGIVQRIARELRSPFIVHLSAGTTLGRNPTSKVLAGSIEHAVRLGASAVSAQLHFGGVHEGRMVDEAERAIEEAHALGLPVLVMAYAPSDAGGIATDPDAARDALRSAAMLGADVVQTNFAGAAAGVRYIVRGCPVPTLLAGGPRIPSDEAFFETMRSGIEAGASGVTIGRNLFRRANVQTFARRLGAVVFGGPREVAMEVRGP